MRHNWLTAFCAAALAALCLTPAYAEGPAAPAAETVLVGLAHGDGALAGANLKNDTGSGYRFGWLDADRTFQIVGETAETDLSVVKTQNVWYGSYNDYTSYSDAITSDIAVGCWHVELPLAPADFAEAKALADEAGGFPAWIGGSETPYRVRVGAYITQEEARALADTLEGGKVVGTSAYGVSVVKTGTAQVLFQFDGGAEKSLCVQPAAAAGEKPVTWFKGCRYYGAFQYRRVEGET